MEWHQEPRWTSKDQEDSELPLTQRRNCREKPASGTNGLMRESSSPANLLRTLIQYSILMLLRQVLNLCTTFQRHYNYTLWSVYIAPINGKTWRSFSRMRSSQERESIKFWTLLGLKEHSQSTISIHLIAFMEQMLIWLCWVWVLMSHTFISWESLSNKTISKKIIEEVGVEKSQRLQKPAVKKKHQVKSSNIVKFQW